MAVVKYLTTKDIAEQIKLQPLKWSDGPVALVLAPTRELAVQIIAESNAYIRYQN